MSKLNIIIVAFILITSIKGQLCNIWKFGRCYLYGCFWSNYPNDPYYWYNSYLSCNCLPECASHVTGYHNNCSQEGNSYSDKDCLQVTCPLLSPMFPNIDNSDIEECYNEHLRRYITTVVKIITIVFGTTALIMTIIACHVYGVARNAQTGELVWVGCCCCKKNRDCQEDKINKQFNKTNLPIKKINLNTIQQC